MSWSTGGTGPVLMSMTFRSVYYCEYVLCTQQQQRVLIYEWCSFMLFVCVFVYTTSIAHIVRIIVRAQLQCWEKQQDLFYCSRSVLLNYLVENLKTNYIVLVENYGWFFSSLLFESKLTKRGTTWSQTTPITLSLVLHIGLAQQQPNNAMVSIDICCLSWRLCW